MSEAGNHDNREYEDDWGEKWQGLLERNADGTDTYDNQANQNLAQNLKGHLLLAHGSTDSNVPPYNTLLLVNALIKANKDFDLLILPNRNHGFGNEPYMIRRRWDYFVRYLMGAEPPMEYEFRQERNLVPLNSGKREEGRREEGAGSGEREGMRDLRAGRGAEWWGLDPRKAPSEGREAPEAGSGKRETITNVGTWRKSWRATRGGRSWSARGFAAARREISRREANPRRAEGPPAPRCEAGSGKRRKTLVRGDGMAPRGGWWGLARPTPNQPRPDGIPPQIRSSIEFPGSSYAASRLPRCGPCRDACRALAQHPLTQPVDAVETDSPKASRSWPTP